MRRCCVCSWILQRGTAAPSCGWPGACGGVESMPMYGSQKPLSRQEVSAAFGMVWT